MIAPNWRPYKPDFRAKGPGPRTRAVAVAVSLGCTTVGRLAAEWRISCEQAYQLIRKAVRHGLVTTVRCGNKVTFKSNT